MIRNFFSFVSPPSKRIFSLDIIRGVAILLVLFYHNPTYPDYRPLIYWPITYMNKVGWMGVDLFFVLSGYLVGGLIIREIKKSGTLRVKRFIIRRGFKIWPVYYFSILAFLFVRPFSEKDLGANYLERWMSLFWEHLPNFLHVQNYFSSTQRMGWLWSLGVEEHFYLAAPFFLLFFLGQKNRSQVFRKKNPLGLCRYFSRMPRLALPFAEIPRVFHKSLHIYFPQPSSYRFPSSRCLSRLFGGPLSTDL